MSDGSGITKRAARPGLAVSITAAHAESAILGGSDFNYIGCVRLISTVDCWVDIGPSAVAAATTGTFLPAYTPEYFNADSNDVVSVIRTTADGTLYVRSFI